MSKQPIKYVFVTGGVLSGLGKGITAASIGNILKARGFKINIQKCDPYLNIDAGTLNPAEHGECFVTRDGAETDLDLGHYERFLDQELDQSSSLMSGRVLYKVINDERNGKYLGSTVQFIPHVTKAIQKEIEKASKGFDVHIVEIGGTVGDYEGLSFLEAIREFGLSVGRENCIFVHVVYMPYLGASQEFKTKPAQNAVRELRGLGIFPDILVSRSENTAPASVIKKLSLFSGVSEDAIVLLPNASTIYEVPITLEETGIAKVILDKLKLKYSKSKLDDWAELVERAQKTYEKNITIGIVAKYLDNQDTYMSVTEALKAAAWSEGVELNIEWIDSTSLEDMSIPQISNVIKCDGIVIPGGFGKRGIEGKIKAAQFSLKSKIPYLGLCLGLQVGVIAAARNAGLVEANSVEIDPGTKHPVINTMFGQIGKENTGGTMRLGEYPCVLTKNSLAIGLYKKNLIHERHRHRYECNNVYRDQYRDWGIKVAGHSPDESLVEMIEGIDHPYFLASQFHPEFKSRPNKPHPMFTGLIRASIVRKR
ncbi:MAG TPA: CTP synthase [Candidatus Dormibacteraeota bacterium]|nr:CTP synthase [Candidatus Dormibacteraeota bacterium]